MFPGTPQANGASPYPSAWSAGPAAPPAGAVKATDRPRKQTHRLPARGPGGGAT